VREPSEPTRGCPDATERSAPRLPGAGGEGEAPAQPEGGRWRTPPVVPVVADVFERAVDEGERQLERRWLEPCASGAVGGIDVGMGVLALLLVRRMTGSEGLAALAFGIGFVARTLAQSELLTENFLVPIAAIAAGRASVARLLRLCLVTLVFNLAGGWVISGLIIAGAPSLTRPPSRSPGTTRTSGTGSTRSHWPCSPAAPSP